MTTKTEIKTPYDRDFEVINHEDGSAHLRVADSSNQPVDDLPKLISSYLPRKTVRELVEALGGTLQEPKVIVNDCDGSPRVLKVDEDGDLLFADTEDDEWATFGVSKDSLPALRDFLNRHLVDATS
jgi:hypothetical protein